MWSPASARARHFWAVKNTEWQKRAPNIRAILKKEYGGTGEDIKFREDTFDYYNDPEDTTETANLSSTSPSSSMPYSVSVVDSGYVLEVINNNIQKSLMWD